MLFLYNCDVCKTVKHVKILPKNFIKRCITLQRYAYNIDIIVNMKGRICVLKNN